MITITKKELEDLIKESLASDKFLGVNEPYCLITRDEFFNYRCSSCNKPIKDKTILRKAEVTHYCPSCGRKALKKTKEYIDALYKKITPNGVDFIKEDK